MKIEIILKEHHTNLSKLRDRENRVLPCITVKPRELSGQLPKLPDRRASCRNARPYPAGCERDERLLLGLSQPPSSIPPLQRVRLLSSYPGGVHACRVVHVEYRHRPGRISGACGIGRGSRTRYLSVFYSDPFSLLHLICCKLELL